MTNGAENTIDKATIEAEILRADGLLRLAPTFVARDWIPEGRRLPIPGGDYDAGERGTFSERWLASTTRADNRLGPPDEGLSYLRASDGSLFLLAAAIDVAFASIAGEQYASTHTGLGRLAKIFDYDARVPFHIHPPVEQAAKVGRNSKDEAYYFPPQSDMGRHPETFLGLHPSFAGGAGAERVLGHLRAWDSDAILGLSQAYQQIAEEGFFVPSGVLHGPGTAMTIELQEDSDTLAMLQAVNDGRPISKDLLFKDISPADREAYAEAAVLEWIDWERNADPRLHEHSNFAPIEFHASEGVSEAWVFIGTRKFSGKRLWLQPGSHYTTTERGVFNLLVLQGSGMIAGVPVEGGNPGDDELLVVDDRAIEPIEYVNMGSEPMLVIKFFGPDINPDSPLIEPRNAGLVTH